jgi:Raf kinase inhibitor-like YbhB/YbcL family protein
MPAPPCKHLTGQHRTRCCADTPRRRVASGTVSHRRSIPQSIADGAARRWEAVWARPRSGTLPSPEDTGARNLARAGTRILCGVACAALAGCGLIGGPGAVGADVPDTITVTSAAFRDQGPIPERYTCFGAGVSPPIHWSGVPAGTRALALLVDDAGAPVKPYVYWIVFDISSQTTEFQEDSLPPGALQGQASNGRARYNPPCPGPGSHSYRFTVYALSEPVSLPAGAGLIQVWSAIAQDAIARGRLTGTAVPPPGHTS